MGEATTVSPPPPMPAVAAPGRAQLYVGDLHPEVTEADLVSMFSYFGDILSARVCRDRDSGESLRYAYINFAASLNAVNALRVLNHISLKGKPMRIMWINRNPIGRKNGVGNLFVKNLEESIGGAELEKYFNPFGQVDSCKVEVDEKGRSRGFGFVQMNTEEAAQAAIAALHGIVLSGANKKLYVAKFVRKCEREAPPQRPHSSNSNLYIKNLEKYLTGDSLREKFSEYGKIINAVVIKDEIGKSRGFGFVNFKYPEDAKKAMEAMNGAKFGSKTLFVGPAQKKAERHYTLTKHFGDAHDQHPNKILATTVSVKNLDGSVTEKTLQEHFASCGKILCLKVLSHGSQQSEGFGFVRFSSFEEAIKAVVTRNGTKLNGKTLYVAIDNGQTQVYYPPYYNGQTHYLASTYQSSRLVFPIGSRGFRSLNSQSYYQQEPFLKPACYAPFNSPMHPFMIYPPQEEAYHMQQDRYVNDYYLNQSYMQPTSYEMGMKKVPRNQHIPLGNLNALNCQQHKPKMCSKPKARDAAGSTDC